MRIPWAIVAGTALVAVVAAVASGFAVSCQTRSGFALVVLGAALYYYRAQPKFALCLTALLQIVVFSTAFVVLTYVGARIAPPLVDVRLAAWDAALGFNVASLVAWRTRHPILGELLESAYNSLLLQTAAVVALLGLRGDRRLESFVLRMMLGGLITLVVFLLMPAEGPFSAYGFSPSASQAHYLEHLRALRNGTKTSLNLGDVEGLITFPSFHTVWALLLIAACRHQPIIRIFVAVLNGAVVLATMTTGWHYLSDVLGGIMVFAVVSLLPTRKGDWLRGRSRFGAGNSRYCRGARPLWPFLRAGER